MVDIYKSIGAVIRADIKKSLRRLKKMDTFVDDRGYSNFDIFPLKEGQINLCEINDGAIKAFHRHKKQTDFWFCTDGEMLVILVDEERGKIERIVLSSRIPRVIEIKPGIWHGYRSLGGKKSSLLYFTTKRYDANNPDEERREWDFFGKDVWEVRNK